MFYQFICTVSPPLLATLLFYHWNHKNLSLVHLLCIFIIMLGAVNMFPLLALTLIGHGHYVPWIASANFCAKYLVVGFLTAVALPRCVLWIAHHVHIETVIEDTETVGENK